MNDQAEIPTKPKRTRAPKTPRTRKPIDPRKLALRAEYSEKLKAVDREDASARMLRVIVEKRLPKMTPAHRAELFAVLSKTETPGLDLPRS